ncbi:MAG TPA: heparinase II/III family protein [Burkholderiales bacterium]
MLSGWYTLRWSTCNRDETCIDLAKKAWVRNFGRFLAYFNPPTLAPGLAVQDDRIGGAGTPIGLFGDGFADLQLFELRARVAKGYAHFVPDALNCWYASNLVGEDATRIEFLMSPADSCPARASMPQSTPGSLFLPSIGWIAMHSNLADPDRTSVYFKSSPLPFGAYNHQSADQNAFVINAGGRRLAIESGYYDAYNSNHWQYWLKRTWSKNAITFDGGLGQIAFEHQPKPYLPENLGYGVITQQHSAADYDIVTGDATDAYKGVLTRAVRSLVYLRPDTVLIYDNLASLTPRTWEWNTHALDPIKSIDAGSRVQIARDGRSLCVESLVDPGVRFTQSNVWPVGAEPATGERQWHGKFVSTQSANTAELAMLLRVGCRRNAAYVARTDAGWRVTVGNRTITIDAKGIVSVSR